MNFDLDILFSLQVFSCFFMTGVIWLVQILVYPLFLHIDPQQFSKIHRFHTRRISWVVVPMMILELVTALWILFEKSNPRFLLLGGLLVTLWIVTFLVSVPLHSRLEKEWNLSTIRLLVATNWLRTILWSLRSFLWIEYFT